jgi:hypothetical protein
MSKSRLEAIRESNERMVARRRVPEGLPPV